MSSGRIRLVGDYADPFFRLGIWIGGGVLALAVLVQAFKMVDLYMEVVQGLIYIRLPVITLPFVASFFLAIRYGFRVRWIDLILAVLFFWGAIVTALYGGKATDIGANILRLTFVFTCYQVVSQYAGVKNSRKSLKILGGFGGVSVMLALALMYYFWAVEGRSLYAGLSTQGLFIPLAYFLSREKKWDWVWVGCLVALIIAGGKRGNMLAALLMIAVGVIFVRRMSILKVTLLVPVTLGGVMLVASVDPFPLLGTLPDPIARRFMPFISEAGLNPQGATLKRFSEVRKVIEKFQLEPVAMLSGFGWGGTIAVDGRSVSTVHMSPVWIAFQYGIPFAVLLFGTICWIPLRTLMRGYRNSLENRIWCLTAIGLLALSLTVMNIFQDVVLWFALGFLSVSNSSEIVHIRSFHSISHRRRKPVPS